MSAVRGGLRSVKESARAMVGVSIEEALSRARGGALRVLDLFSGCGGLSLGFQKAGATVLAGVEFEPIRAATHAYNFHRRLGERLAHEHARGRDLRTTSPSQLFRELELGPLRGTVDVIVGGPPCQAYARIGRAKLREVFKHPEAFARDERGTLWMRYLHYVNETVPLAVLMENVPDILDYGGRNIADEIVSELDELGYDCAYTLLNAANYGVPQMRERWFLLGIRRELGVRPSFPPATHWFDVPVGFRGTRAKMTSLLAEGHNNTLPLFSKWSPVTARPLVAPTLPQAVSCRDALHDLPRITLDSEKRRRGARNLRERERWRFEAKTEFQHTVREWPGFLPSLDGVTAHVIRHLPRDYAIFERMQPGDEYPRARVIAEELFREARKRISPRPAEGSAEWDELWQQYVPPYDPTKFPNKWRMLEPDQPARTLMAHLSHDSYSHIHYDKSQARTISVREAARLQSFPDGFEFEGAMNAAFGQIGNAVPPLMAYALATHLHGLLRSSSYRSSLEPSLVAAG